MVVRWICILLWNLVAFWTVASMVAPLRVTSDLENRQIATHRILKSYDDENTGLRLGGISIILEDRPGRYWFGNWFGAYMFDEHLDIWKSYTKEGGQLAAREVSMIGRSGDNKLWFAPDDGWVLSNFDGESWRKMDSKSIASNVQRQVSTLFTGHDGRIWVALEEVLVAYDAEKWTSVLDLMKEPSQLAKRVAGERKVSRSGVRIRAGLLDREGYIWLATPKGIIRFDEAQRGWRIYTEAKLCNANRAYQDRKGRIWFADSGGQINVYNKSSDSWNYFNLLDHMPRSVRNQLKADPTGNYFLGVTGIYQDWAGQIFIGTLHGLMTYMETENEWEFFTNENSGLLSNTVTSIMEDYSGKIWVGTGKGIVVLEQ